MRGSHFYTTNQFFFLPFFRPLLEGVTDEFSNASHNHLNPNCFLRVSYPSHSFFHFLTSGDPARTGTRSGERDFAKIAKT
jgi:hypothetical protein